MILVGCAKTIPTVRPNAAAANGGTCVNAAALVCPAIAIRAAELTNRRGLILLSRSIRTDRGIKGETRSPSGQ